MEFILIMLADREAPEDPTLYPEMGQFAGELARTGKHPRALRLRNQRGARIGDESRDAPSP